MLRLSDRVWKSLYIGELFLVKRPETRSEKNYAIGDVPFIASGNTNNGVIKCCTPQKHEILDRKNCISVSPVDGSAFYHEYNFLGRGGAGSSVLLLYNDRLNRYSGLFMTRMIRQTCAKYCYGKMGNKDGIKREKIMLPVDKNGSPDYAFMEAYMKEREEYLIRKYERFIFEREKTIGGGGGGKKSYFMEVLLFDRNIPQNQTWKTTQAGRPHLRNYAVCLFFKRYQRYRRIHLEQQRCPNLCKLPDDSEQRECRFVSLSSLSFRRKRSCNESA